MNCFQTLSAIALAQPDVLREFEQADTENGMMGSDPSQMYAISGGNYTVCDGMCSLQRRLELPQVIHEGIL